jgi:hypothetical protein
MTAPVNEARSTTVHSKLKPWPILAVVIVHRFTAAVRALCN